MKVQNTCFIINLRTKGRTHKKKEKKKGATGKRKEVQWASEPVSKSERERE